MSRVLDGVTIVAASIAEAGPVCTQILALMGAKVIHVERPAHQKDHDLFKHEGLVIRNTNKQLVTLDTKSEEGRAIMWKLIEKADVFIENFAPGAWERMGFSYDEVKKHNPNIIYGTVKGFSRESKWSKAIAYDPIATTAGGSTYLSGYEDGVPMLCGINVADSGTGIHTAVGILTALLYRKITGKGQKVETSMQNTVIAECRRMFAEYSFLGKVRRAGNSYRGLKPTAPYNIYPTQGKDIYGNYVCIACSAEESSTDFQNLCKAMGREDLLENPCYATPQLRYENRAALDAEITKWTLRHTGNEVVELLAGVYQIPAGRVNSLADICADETLSGLGRVMQHVTDDPIIEDLHMPTIPLHFSNGDPVEAKSCSIQGSANEEIYKSYLGLSDEEYNALAEKGII